eukprot:8412959-Pyramimonas_sp.AAC.1
MPIGREGGNIDLATRGFVDDIGRKDIGANSHHLRKLCAWENLIIDAGLEDIGGAHNREAQYNIVQGAKRHAQKLNR